MANSVPLQWLKFAMPESVTQLDSRIEVVTPENIAYQFRIAGPFRRALAYLIDLAIIVVAMVSLFLALAISSLISGLGGYASLPILIILFIAMWFYGGFFETVWNGQTPGKRLTGVRVVTVEGQPIDAMQATLRNVLRLLDGFPFFLLPLAQEIRLLQAFPMPTFQFGLIAMLCSRRYQRMGDLVCGTIVVIDDKSWLVGVTKITEPEAIRLAAFVPANFRPSRSLSKAISSYVDRRNRFSWGRRAEIVRHLGEPLRAQFKLPPQVNLDMLLCAVYYHTFVLDQTGSRPSAQGRRPPAPPVMLPPPDRWQNSSHADSNYDPWQANS